MKRSILIGMIGFCLGIIVMAGTLHLSADEPEKGHFVRLSDMEWKGQDSHGPKTALKWIFGRQSDVKMKTIESFWVTTIGPGGFNKPHSHKDEEQIYYILEGEGRMVVGDQEIPATKGDVAYFPMGVKHGFYNDGDKPVLFIGIAAKVPSSE